MRGLDNNSNNKAVAESVTGRELPNAYALANRLYALVGHSEARAARLLNISRQRFHSLRANPNRDIASNVYKRMVVAWEQLEESNGKS